MKKILQINIILMMLFMFISPVSALNDGAYLVSRSTSYTNPLTGKTEDGGENIALGESMVSNINYWLNKLMESIISLLV